MSDNVDYPTDPDFPFSTQIFSHTKEENRHRHACTPTHTLSHMHTNPTKDH